MEPATRSGNGSGCLLEDRLREENLRKDSTAGDTGMNPWRQWKEVLRFQTLKRVVGLVDAAVVDENAVGRIEIGIHGPIFLENAAEFSNLSHAGAGCIRTQERAGGRALPLPGAVRLLFCIAVEPVRSLSCDGLRPSERGGRPEMAAGRPEMAAEHSEHVEECPEGRREPGCRLVEERPGLGCRLAGRRSPLVPEWR